MKALLMRHWRFIRGAIAATPAQALVAGILLLTGSLSYSQASPQQVTAQAIPINDLTSQPLRTPAEFQIDNRATSPQDLSEQAYAPLDDQRVNQGITDQVYWIRVRLSNRINDQPRSWVLHHETSYLDELTIYYADNGGSMQKVALSDRVSFPQRPITYRTLAYAHTTPAGGYTDIYIRLSYKKADAMSLNIHLSDANWFDSHSRSEYLVYGGYYGLMISLLIIALIFAIAMHDTVYLYYAAFLVSSLLMWAMLNGFDYQYLWPHSVWMHNEGFHIVYLLTAIAALQFSRRFLQTEYCCPRINTAMRIAQWLMFSTILVRLAGIYVPVLYISFFSLALLALLPVPGYIAYRSGFTYARWYSFAWLFYGVSLLFSALSASTNLFSWGLTPLFFAQAGGMLEAVLLLVALGERLLNWDRERRYALKIANQDPLTGLGNRRALEEAFTRIKSSHSSRGKYICLIMIDLDHFKEINDRYGHDTGDQILRQFASLLRGQCRESDILVRYGGEEFAVLAQTDTPARGWHLAERIRESFAATPTSHKQQDITHTLTAGLGCMRASDSIFGQAELVRQADEALYRAKESGRNRTMAYQDMA